MAIKPKNLTDFTIRTADALVEGQNIVVIRGGSTVIGSTWLQYGDLRLDIAKLITQYVSTNSRRLFNEIGGIAYLLLALDEQSIVSLIPSISFNSTGSVKAFPDLGNRLPLALLKLVQDGTVGLTGYNPITLNDIEVYQGYGNLTLRGAIGATGPQGDTGVYGNRGLQGVTGIEGLTGIAGATGLPIAMFTGETGIRGDQGLVAYKYIVSSLNAAFSADRTNILEGSVVQFKNYTQGPAVTFAWDFGDGGTSVESNPAHAYGAAGLYTVTLTTEALNGNSDTETKTDYILVLPNV